MNLIMINVDMIEDSNPFGVISLSLSNVMSLGSDFTKL